MRPRCLTPPVLIAPLKMQYRCMNIIWHPHDHHLARYSYLYNRLRGQWSSSLAVWSMQPGCAKTKYTCFHLGSLAAQTPLPSSTCKPRVSTCVEGYQRLHLARKAMIISRCTHKNWLAWCAVACPPSRGSFAAPPLFGGVLCLFQTSLLKAVDRPLMPDRQELGQKQFLSSKILSLNLNRWIDWLIVKIAEFFFSVSAMVHEI